MNEKKRNGKENQVKSGMRGLHSDCGDDKYRCDDGVVIDALNTFFYLDENALSRIKSDE